MKRNKSTSAQLDMISVFMVSAFELLVWVLSIGYRT